MKTIEMNIEDKIAKLMKGFKSVLYEEDEHFLECMKSRNLAGDDVHHYMFWEWTQGVGLYGFYMLYEQTGEKRYLKLLEDYYQRCFKIGLPARNVNTCAPMLTLALFANKTSNSKYLSVCRQWADWYLEDMPRTEEGGFQHITSDSLNDGELWDDTLFMTVLFLAVMGGITGDKRYSEEAIFQVLIHQKYLADKKTGLWYHGWTYNGRHNFAEAFWGRGNCWITAFIPLFLEYCDLPDSICKYLVSILKAQCDALVKYQDDESGLWHTLIDDDSSYLEVSASCGFGFGMLRSCHDGLLPDNYKDVALKALDSVLENITEDGVVTKVSYGTPMGRNSKDFYKEIPYRSMPYGTALALLFLIEAQKEYISIDKKKILSM